MQAMVELESYNVRKLTMDPITVIANNSNLSSVQRKMTVDAIKIMSTQNKNIISTNEAHKYKGLLQNLENLARDLHCDRIDGDDLTPSSSASYSSSSPRMFYRPS